MTKDQSIEILLNKASAISDRYLRPYGQIIQRLDGDTYLMSDENLVLSSLKKGDIKEYNIKTGDIGKLLRKRKDINAIVFAVTECSVKFSSNNSVMYPALDDLAEIIGAEVKVCSTSSIHEILKALKNANGCFIKNSGMFAVGSTLDEAIAGIRIMEKSVEIEHYGKQLGKIYYLPKNDAKTLHGYYRKKYSTVNKSGHADFVNIDMKEFEMRNHLIETGRRLVDSELVQGTWGNLSLRISATEMLITPTGMNYYDIRSEDIVRVDINTLSYGRQSREPSSEYKLHARIYREHPETSVVIHTHSNGCSVFAAAHAGFRITNPALHEAIGDVNITEREMPGTHRLEDAVIEGLGDGHACIIANHGAIFTGSNLDFVFRLADTVETKACHLLGMCE